MLEIHAKEHIGFHVKWPLKLFDLYVNGRSLRDICKIAEYNVIKIGLSVLKLMFTDKLADGTVLIGGPQIFKTQII
jgi:hypothetical protein